MVMGFYTATFITRRDHLYQRLYGRKFSTCSMDLNTQVKGLNKISNRPLLLAVSKKGHMYVGITKIKRIRHSKVILHEFPHAEKSVLTHHY